MELIVFAVLVALAVGIGAVALMRAGSADQAHRRGPMAAFGHLLDRSVGMYTLRQALGRSTLTGADRAAARIRAEAEAQAAADTAAARRAAAFGGPVPIRPSRIVVAGTASVPPRPEERGRQAHPSAVVGATSGVGFVAGPAGPDRVRLWRDSAVALAGLAAVLAIAIAVWPRGDGGVLSVTSGPTDVPTVNSPSPTASATPSPTPTASATPSPTPSPSPTPTASATLSPTPSRRPSAKPTTSTPIPSPSATTPTPSPTLLPSPTQAPSPTPDPTPIPTPDPTPIPTPEPTPIPTPEPTPVPTPEPTPIP